MATCSTELIFNLTLHITGRTRLFACSRQAYFLTTNTGEYANTPCIGLTHFLKWHTEIKPKPKLISQLQLTPAAS